MAKPSLNFSPRFIWRNRHERGACVLLGKIGIGDWLKAHRLGQPRRVVPLEGERSAARRSNRGDGLIALPLLQQVWVMVK